ncbi:MAG: sulfurtransferase [Nocardioidaceae bacterium]
MALITATELADRLSSVTILDVRWRLAGPSTRVDYDDGHIPGAAFVDLDVDLAEPPGEHGRHPLPGVERFQQAMRRCGVCQGLPVVCYDFADGTSAARAWWLLRYFGHGDVRLLDGGYAAWLDAGGPVSRDVPDHRSGDFEATPGQLPVLDADGAQQVARSGLLVDGRAAERYSGEREPMDPVAGHVPGAVSAPTSENVDPTGRFLDPQRLRERFTRLGASQTEPVAAYCGSGVTAAHEVLALELAGFDAGLYADSWSGWITDPTREVATGALPG